MSGSTYACSPSCSTDSANTSNGINNNISSRCGEFRVCTCACSRADCRPISSPRPQCVHSGVHTCVPCQCVAALLDTSGKCTHSLSMPLLCLSPGSQYLMYSILSLSMIMIGFPQGGLCAAGCVPQREPMLSVWPSFFAAIFLTYFLYEHIVFLFHAFLVGGLSPAEKMAIAHSTHSAYSLCPHVHERIHHTFGAAAMAHSVQHQPCVNLCAYKPFCSCHHCPW